LAAGFQFFGFSSLNIGDQFVLQTDTFLDFGLNYANLLLAVFVGGWPGVARFLLFSIPKSAVDSPGFFSSFPPHFQFD
jgi:hypothetical protein